MKESVNQSQQGNSNTFPVSHCAVSVFLHGLELNGNITAQLTKLRTVQFVW